MRWRSRQATNPTTDAGLRRWRRSATWVGTSLRDWRRVCVLALALVLLAGVPTLVLVAGLRPARAATSSVAALPGTPYVWGLNGDGELGMATTATCSGYPCSPTPLALSALPNVQAAAGGDLHSIVATADGSVYTWGSNESGQLGVTTQQTCFGQPCSPIPVQVAGMPAVTAVAAGAHHSLALTSTGAVYAWGGNYAGELGTGTTGNTASPVPVTGLPSNIVAVAADGEDSMALTSDGLVYVWGDDTYGQLGTPSTAMTCGTSWCSPTPLQVSGLSGITAIAAGEDYNLALASTGAVYAWGDNTYGTLGNGSTSNSATPVPVAQIANVTAIAAGGSALALTSSGTVYAWGDDMYGELGGSSSQLCGAGYPCGLTPVQVGGLPAGITRIAAGGGFELALAGDSTVWSWGENTIGQLGNGSSDSNPHPTPGQVSGLSGVGALATGGNHSITIVPPAGSPSPTPTATPPTAPAAALSTTFINFGDQQVGTSSAPAPVTLSNTGTATLMVSGAALSGPNAGDFVLAGGSCVSASGGTSVQVAPGGSCTMTISFQPTAAGTRTGALTVSCDAANCPLTGSVTGNGIDPSGSLSPTAVSFPDTYVGTSTAAPVLIGVCNGGTTNLMVNGISLGGADPGDFTYSIISGTLPLAVTPGDCASIYTTFTPSAAGARAAILSFATNDSLHVLNATLSGNGVLPADVGVTLSASPNPIKSGGLLTYTISVTNSGAGSANSVQLSDALPAGTTFYSVATTLGTCSAPAVGGTGTVSCTASNLPNGASFTVTLDVTVTVRPQSNSTVTVTDTASVSASTQDPNTANNSASVTTTVTKH